MLAVAPQVPTVRLKATTFGEVMRASGWEATSAGFVTSERLDAKDEAYLEISFGPLADEVLVRVRIDGVESIEDSPRSRIEVTFLPGQRERLRYVEEVLAGTRSAAARGSRRHPSQLAVHWDLGGQPRRSRLRDISRGGAFILSTEAPRIGERLSVLLRVQDDAPIAVPSVVSWVRPASGYDRSISGFGVCFKPTDPSVARRLSEVVRRHEAVTVV